MIAVSLAREAMRSPPAPHALVIGLTGELGSGKTTFVQGFARGLGIRENIGSPTFILIKKFQIPNPKSERSPKSKIPKPKTRRPEFLYHIDCYRLESPKELLSFGWEEITRNPAHIVLVEWAEKIKPYLPRDALLIFFEHRGKGKRVLGRKIPNPNPQNPIREVPNS